MLSTQYVRIPRAVRWLLFGFILLSSAARAQTQRSIISGTVTDSSGAVLKGASIRLAPLGVVAVADAQGQFTLPDIAAGHYTLTASFVGFRTFTKEFDIAVGQPVNLLIPMEVGSQSEGILVTAERAHGEADAINETRTADNILQVLPAEVITSLPNANVADAIGRLPSVTLYRIEGEGVYIQVRGTEPRLTNVTVDGITLPAPEPTVRQVRLDVIPSELVESVELNKTLSANQDANGIGGSDDLRIKRAGEEPTINAFVKGGYTPILNGRTAAETGVTYGKRFGATHRFGLLVNGSYDYNGRGIDNFQPALDPYSTFAEPFYDNNTIREYRYYRYRYGFAGSADYKINENSNLFAHGFYTDLKDWGDKWYYEPVSNPLPSTGGTPATKLQAPKFYTSSKRPDASVSSYAIGGHHILTDSWITWQLAASRSYENDSAGNPKADFSWNTTKILCNYDPNAQANIFEPHFGDCDGPNSPLQVASNWAFKDITTSRGTSTQLDLTGMASYAHNYSLHGHFGIVEAGFKFANAHKSQDATETVYDGWATSGSAAIPMTALQSGYETSNYFDGKFFGGHFGPVSDFNKVQDYTLTNLSGHVDGYKTAADTWPNVFHTIEQIPAGYVMNTIDLGHVHLQTGLRIEATNMQTSGYNVILYAAGDPNCGGSSNTGCGVPVPVQNNPSYIDVLPSVQIRYGIDNDSNLRAVYARGVARPDPYQLVPYVTEDDSSNPATIAIGNPSLRPEHANNYDLLYERFLNPLGMFQAGIFAKQISAPQLLFQIPAGVDVAALPPGTLPPSLLDAVEEYQNNQLGLSSVSQYINGENTFLYGFEIGYQQHLSFLPGFLSGFGATANYSYTNSREKGVPLRNDHPRMIDQAMNTWNVSPTYDTNRLSVRVGLTYNGSSLFSYNWISPAVAPGAGADPSGLGPQGPSGDIWTMPHFQADAQATYRVWRGLSALVSGLNLNNEVFGYYQGSTMFVNQREYYKPTYSGGLRYNFGGHESKN